MITKGEVAVDDSNEAVHQDFFWKRESTLDWGIPEVDTFEEVMLE